MTLKNIKESGILIFLFLVFLFALPSLLFFIKIAASILDIVFSISEIEFIIFKSSLLISFKKEVGV